jgi:uncharacterized protein (UPF0548 family)
MLSLRHPQPEAIAAYRAERLNVAPTSRVSDRPPAGFRSDKFSRMIGDRDSFERARAGLQQWVAHRGSGVEIFPDDAEIVEGETVAIVTRQLGLWVLASCRIENVTDEATEFGFVYATLPDHPECGYESFTVHTDETGVRFDIEAVSKPGIPLVRLGAPAAHLIQRRATNGYLDAMHERTHAAR